LIGFKKQSMQSDWWRVCADWSWVCEYFGALDILDRACTKSLKK